MQWNELTVGDKSIEDKSAVFTLVVVKYLFIYEVKKSGVGLTRQCVVESI